MQEIAAASDAALRLIVPRGRKAARAPPRVAWTRPVRIRACLARHFGACSWPSLSGTCRIGGSLPLHS